MSSFIIVFLWLAPLYALAGVASVIIQTERSPTPWRRKDFADVKPWFAILLRRGYKGGHVLLVDAPSGRSLRFRKYIRAKGDYGLELCFPTADWATEYWQRIQAHCEEVGLRNRVETEVMDGSPNGVLLIDCERNTDRAYSLALTIWTEIFDLPIRGWYEREGDGISVRDELIDSPDHRRLTEQEVSELRWSKIRRDLRERIGISPAGVYYVSGLMVLTMVAIVGLAFATLVSIGDPPSWSVEAGSLTVGGSIPSVIFFLLHIITWVALFRFIRRMKKPQMKASTLYENLYMTGLGFIVIALPVTVIMVWTGA